MTLHFSELVKYNKKLGVCVIFVVVVVAINLVKPKCIDPLQIY